MLFGGSLSNVLLNCRKEWRRFYDPFSTYKCFSTFSADQPQGPITVAHPQSYIRKCILSFNPFSFLQPLQHYSVNWAITGIPIKMTSLYSSWIKHDHIICYYYLVLLIFNNYNLIIIIALFYSLIYVHKLHIFKCTVFCKFSWCEFLRVSWQSWNVHHLNQW